MSEANLEKRVAALEAIVQELLLRLKASQDEKRGKDERPWFVQFAGSFRGDQLYKEAMDLGQEYRESLRPKSRKKRKPTDGHT